MYNGHLSVCKLLKKKIVEYTKDEKETSCLHIAIMRGHAHIVDFLLAPTKKYEEDTTSPQKNMKPDEKARLEAERMKRQKAVN